VGGATRLDRLGHRARRRSQAAGLYRGEAQGGGGRRGVGTERVRRRDRGSEHADERSAGEPVVERAPCERGTDECGGVVPDDDRGQQRAAVESLAFGQRESG
jgi:hypothetical protein